MLGLLRPRYKLGLLSDGFLPAQRLKLDAIGLGKFFDAILFTEDIGREAWKPSTTGFDHIRQQLGLGHEACAYVADNPAKDFVAPNELGWLSVQWPRPGQVHSHKAAASGGRPKLKVHSPGELWQALL